MRTVKLPENEITERYIAGESTTALARAYAVSPRTIGLRLRAACVGMRPPGGQRKRGGPLHRCNGYIETADREGKSCRVHRGCWEAYHGPILPGDVVHHINGNLADYHIENLVCMSRGAHMNLHRKERANNG